MSAKVRDFVEVWQDLDNKGKERSLRFLIELYGKDKLLTYMRFIETVSKFTIENLEVK